MGKKHLIKEKLNPEKFIESYCVGLVEKVTKSNIKIRQNLAWTCIGIIIFSVLASYFIIFFVGFGLMSNLPVGFLNWLGAATLGAIISNILIVYKSVFPYKDPK